MLTNRLLPALRGILYYYGLISIDELLTIGWKAELWEPSDYKVCLHQIWKEAARRTDMYSYGNCICHNLLVSPKLLQEMQDHSCIASYKLFSAEEYYSAGETELYQLQEMLIFEQYLSSHSVLSEQQAREETFRIWKALNNMQDLLTLTDECISVMKLPYHRGDQEYYRVLTEINDLANNMPRWFCKGYSYSEAIAFSAKYA